MASSRAVDPQKLESFMGKMVNDMGAALSGSLVITGAKLGSVQGAGRHGTLHVARSGRAHRHLAPICARVACGPGGFRLRRL